jgi:hypothetical protein
VATHDRTVNVFGGTGFLGRRIVRHLRDHGSSVRLASRDPDRGHRLFGTDDPHLQSVQADVQDERSVVDALAGAYGVVNAVSLYAEHGQKTFHSIYVESPNGWQLKHAGPESNDLSTFQESAPIPPHHPDTFESGAKANWQSGPRSKMHF